MSRSKSASPGGRGLWRIERDLWRRGFAHIAGVDEAGRGPLAGPVVAAAAILPPRCRLPGLADSKLLSAVRRERLYDLITGRALRIGIGLAEAGTVDRLNVLTATHAAMQAAIEQLDPPPELLLVDGRGLPGARIPQRAIVGGDRMCASIAAASILAKVVRDRLMMELDERYPEYGFGKHKGYATREHLARLAELGPCPEHRLSFAPVRAAVQTRLPLSH